MDRRRLTIVLAALALVLVALGALVLRPLLVSLAGARVREAASRRGLAASWRSLEVDLPARATFRGLMLTQRAGGDTLFRADSLVVALDPWSMLGTPRPSRVTLAHARWALRGAAAEDTLVESSPRDEKADPERARRLRRSVEQLVQLLAAPARGLPRLELSDVTLAAGSRSEVVWSGVRLAWLELRPRRGAVHLAAVGALLGEQTVPFEASLDYGRDDRLSGGARLGIPDPETGKPWPMLITIQGALSQNRRRGQVQTADSTRIVIGRIPFTVGASLTRAGPAVRVRLAADALTESLVKQSLPPPVLGPLERVGVRGSWDYRLTFDLDLSQPDSVEFTADVIPHGLAIDPERTWLRFQALNGPFVATIHLPRGRLVTRELSESNPNYRPLEAIAPALVSAVVTNEDGGFFRHRGFNPEAVRNSIAENVKAGAFRRGAGTITMQLVRNLYLGHERTLSRKFQEVVLAWVIENLTALGKERLLEIYLNIIEWGPDLHGANEAARFYFDCDAGELSVPEALFLSTIVPSPARWRRRFDAEGRLRPWVRSQMHFIGRAMVAKGWLAPDALPPSELLDVSLRGPARDAFSPADTLAADTTVVGVP